MVDVSELKLLLSEDEIEVVLDKLNMIFGSMNSSHQNEIIQYSAQFSKINKEFRLGLISSGDADVRFNRIRYTLISLLDELEQQAKIKYKSEEKSLKILPGNKKSLNSRSKKLGQRILHDPKVDIESFYYSMWSIFNSIVDRTSLSIKITFIYHEEDTSRFFAKYSFPKKQIKESHIPEVLSYLDSYKIYLDIEENSDLYTYKVFHEFQQLDPDADHGALCPVLLGKYFDSQIEKVDFTNMASGHAKFIAAEELFLKEMVDDFNRKTSECLPIPIIYLGNVVGIIFCMYDRQKMLIRSKLGQDRGLKPHQYLLMIQATREYERIRNSGLDKEQLLSLYQEIILDIDNLDNKHNYNIAGIISGNKFLMQLGYDRFYSTYIKSLS